MQPVFSHCCFCVVLEVAGYAFLVQRSADLRCRPIVGFNMRCISLLETNGKLLSLRWMSLFRKNY